MNDLQRERAPFSAEVWEEIDGEATEVLKLRLAGRKLVDFNGPLGWNTSALDLGRTEKLRARPADGVEAAVRRSLPLVELRVPFVLDREEIEAIERGAKDADLDPVVKAATALSQAEDRAIFAGYPAGQIEGIMTAAKDATLSLSSDFTKYPATVVEALQKLRDAGVSGPYGIALGPRCYAGLTKTVTGAGYPILQHVKQLVDGPIVWAPAVDGAVVMSMRGGDFELSIGRDISIGYWGHDDKKVELYLEESLTFRCLGPEAAVPLVYTDKKKS
ncbi:family 1 encapsulin nanocompartment shell protein [Marinibaculum pumilum]|uniref:Family 1 encapsulin nanocompartment shell protein n=1 Tax=Marinibaculum pumilum TaxID=1766165 RepID=A0ABV7L5A2_9PROT